MILFLLCHSQRYSCCRSLIRSIILSCNFLCCVVLSYLIDDEDEDTENTSLLDE